MSMDSSPASEETCLDLNGSKNALLSILPNNDGSSAAALIEGLLAKKSKYGRPRKNPAFSSYTTYEPHDIEFFIRQVCDHDHIYNRHNALNFDGTIIHQTFDKIETGCQFLSRKNGENAARLWTELASAYKQEKARQDSLPSGVYTKEFESKFPFMRQMWFLETEERNGLEFRIKSDPDSSAWIDNGLARSSSSEVPSRKRPWEGYESVSRLDDSINRLIEVIDRKGEKEPTKGGLHVVHSDLVNHMMKFFESIPKDQHLEYKCKIVMFLESLKPKAGEDQETAKSSKKK